MHRLLVALATLAIAPFLCAQQNALPDGKGKEKVAQYCTACHGTEEFVSQKLNKKDWEEVIEDMKRKGLDLKKADYDEILEYLVAHFGENK
jgi:hypothetical protein